jgi:hypothetical protein
MTMTAFNDEGRITRIFGTHGYIKTDSRMITVKSFLTDEVTEYDSNIANDGNITSGHGGGDYGIMEAFTSAVATGDRSKILSGVDETLESHLMVFAAEESRKTGKTVTI